MEINEAIISGRVVGEPNYSHSVNDEAFLKFNMSVIRDSGIEDIVPILASVRLFECDKMCDGVFIQVVGQYRSHTDIEGHKSVFVLARGIEPCEDCYMNVVFLQGTICQEPCYRDLSSGKEITGLCIANNQKHNKSYYLPVIVWDKFAKEVSDYTVGDMIECKGRIQSRNYYKGDHIFQVYEMNVCSIHKIKGNSQ